MVREMFVTATRIAGRRERCFGALSVVRHPRWPGLAFILFVLAAMLGPSPEARTLDDIRSTNTLRICVAGPAARFYQENGEIFAEFLRVKPDVLMLGDWDRQFQNTDESIVSGETSEPKLLADGTCDVLPNDLYAEIWRTSNMTIVPYYKARRVIVAHRDFRSELKKLSDLAGRSVSVEKGTSYDAWVEQQNRTTFARNPMILMHAPTAESVKLVADKDVEFTVMGSENALGWVRSHIDALRVMFPVEKAVDVGWGIRRNNPMLSAELHRFFEQSKHMGSDLDRSWQHHRGVSLMEYHFFDGSLGGGDIDTKAILRWALGAALVIVLVLSAMAYWNRRLRREIEERVRTESELAAARKVAEEATAAKSMFMANMSHEIRSPMNAIIGIAHLLSETGLPARQHGYVERIQQAAEHLLRVINDILDFSKVEAGKLELEHRNFALQSVLQHVMNLNVEKAATKGLMLDFNVALDVPDALIGDPLRLGQILINYVNNAVKFTERGEVHVSVRLLETDNDEQVLLQFTVTDTGVGVAEGQKGKLFESFQQADVSTTRRYGGTGLGLAISKRLAELMRGTVGYESEYGKGSTFWFTARFGKQREQRTKGQIAPPSRERRTVPRLSGARILLVEDNELNQEVAEGLIAVTGAEVDIAPNGAVAVQRVKEVTYDLVLMDIQMPIMDGLSATRHIRELPGTNKLPIIAVTANVLAPELEKCKEAGMNGHIGKPIDPDALLSVLLKWIPERATQASTESGSRGERTKIPALADVAGLDVTSGLRGVLGNRASYEDLLRRFCARYPDAIVEIRSDLAANDRAAAQRRAHTLKGLAGTIGASALEGTAAGLEHAIKNDDPTVAIDAQLAVAQQELSRLIGALNKTLPRDHPAAATGATVDRFRAEEVISQLESLLRSHDAEAVELFRWNATLLRRAYGSAVAPVENKILTFMFPDALAALRDMKAKISQSH